MNGQVSRATGSKMHNTKSIIFGLAAIILVGIVLIPRYKLTEVPQVAAPFYQVEKDGETWSLKDPKGRKFFSTGINHLIAVDKAGPDGPKYNGLAEHHGNVKQWQAQTLERLDTWNVNTIGAWSTLRGKPYVLELSLSYKWVDVFDAGFESYVHRAALKALARDYMGADYATLDADPLLIGYFTDSELAWGSGYRWSPDPGKKKGFSLFEYYARMKPASGGKKSWASYMAETYHHEWSQLQEVWTVDVDRIEDLTRVTRITPRTPEQFAEAVRVGDGFLRRIAERYFEVTSREMRGHLPHHLNLGVRFARDFPDVVAEVSGHYADVASINVYTRNMTYFRSELSRLYKAAQRPVLITEFSFAARKNRSGNRNRGYKSIEVADDEERGAYYAICAEMFGELPFVVGFHWYQFHDQPTKGTPEKENANFGFVDLEGRVYEDLARSAADANGRVLSLREGR
jgi:hypothetical protein